VSSPRRSPLLWRRRTRNPELDGEGSKSFIDLAEVTHGEMSGALVDVLAHKVECNLVKRLG
jgi:hypothetical protein